MNSDRIVVFMGLPYAGVSTALDVATSHVDHAIGFEGSVDDLDGLQSHYGEIEIVWIHAPPEVRLRRARRLESNVIADSQDLREADERAIDSGLSEIFVGEHYDHMIVNTVAKQDFESQVRGVMERRGSVAVSNDG